MPDTETILAQKRQRMHHIEADYLRTREYLKSPEWQQKRDDVLMRISFTMGQYRPGMDAMQLGITFGQLKQIILEIQQVSDVIVEFEALREEIRRADQRAA